MGDIAQRGNRLTFAKGGKVNTRRENRLEELGRVDAEKAYSRKGKRNLREEKHRIRSELKKGGRPWGTGPKPGTHEFLEHHLHKPRKKKAIGSLVHALTKTAKKYHKKKKLAEDTKKGKFPETESLTHQVGPYVGDVGSERPGIKRREWGKKPGGKSKPDRKYDPYERHGAKKGGKADKNWIQKAVNPKHKGFCTPMTKKTCTPRRKALARTFKKMGRERKAKG